MEVNRNKNWLKGGFKKNVTPYPQQSEQNTESSEYEI